jgi:Mannosylglycerate hydrolase MGH1-like glycoside hydrolase domain
MHAKVSTKAAAKHAAVLQRPESKSLTAEQRRLQECTATQPAWKKWGPYLSERQWGTVREDYSPHGNAWDYFPHDHARSRAYRWGEDGIAGFSDDQQRLCLGLALWNERDPILKERLFGLTNSEGNHGEDVKELYYYLDATPTHSYLKMLYKYPQREYPYADLVHENRRRGIGAPEYELLDTGAFTDNRYFDVFVEYARAGIDDVFMRVTVHNRGPESAVVHVLPQLWFRNTWRWKDGSARPRLHLDSDGHIIAEHTELGARHLYADSKPRLLFTDNETNAARLYGVANAGYVKDAFHERVVNGNEAAVNPAGEGTKAAAWYRLDVPAGGSSEVRLRLADAPQSRPFAAFASVFEARLREADEFYAEVQHDIAGADQRMVQRQAFAGMIWSKQFFHFDIPRWLSGDSAHPPPPAHRKRGRNWEWQHLNNADVISMPDTWEYPWYAAWDLAFHTLPLALIDPQFAKDQLVLLTREWYMHPNGQMPAYEWAFGDVNPPVHAWATWRVFQIDRKQRGDDGDLEFLERVFHKLMLNFTWWVNRKDAEGRNVFQGGFLGLDNIGVFDRSAQLPTGGHIDQADGTSWMAMYALNLMRIALELAQHNHVYEDIATKFFEHFLHIAEAMSNLGEEGIGLWDDQDKFFYDVLHTPDGRMTPLKVRSMVGLIPLFAVETLEPELLEKVPQFKQRLEWFLNYRPDLARLVSHWCHEGRGKRRLLSLLRGHRMKRLLTRMLDENEFLSPYGVRAISKVHEREPYVFPVDGMDLTVRYLPAESDSGLFGGNSNWRGPIWFPVNFLIIESLQKFHHYYGDDFKVECPVGSGNFLTINDVAAELGARLTRIFLKDEDGRRPVFAQYPRLQEDPHFRDYLLFFEYFHGDSGRGVGASHQTGWTGLVAKLLKRRAPET